MSIASLALSALAFTFVEDAPPSAARFAREFGGAGAETGNAIIELDDGYLVFGYTDSEGAGQNDYLLIRTARDGAKRWSKTYGGAGDDIGFAMSRDASDGFLLAGFSTSAGPQAAGGYDILLIDVDADGAERWRKTYGTPADDWCTGIVRCAGGFVLAGQTGAKDHEDGLVVRVKDDGSLAWQTAIPGRGIDRLFAVAPGADGSFLAAGLTTTDSHGARDAWLVRLSGDGKVVDERRVGGAQDDLAHSISGTRDGGAIVTGYRESGSAGKHDAWLIRLDAKGDTLWEKTFGGAADDRAMMSAELDDGGFLTIGYSDREGSMDAWLLRTDAKGEREWERVDPRPQDDRGVFVLPTRDGGFAWTGAVDARASQMPFVKVNAIDGK